MRRLPRHLASAIGIAALFTMGAGIYAAMFGLLDRTGAMIAGGVLVALVLGCLVIGGRG